MTECGFVSMPETLVRRWGMAVAGVYGYMLGCARQQDGVCCKSMGELGAALHLHRATVSRHVSLLEKAGLVRDLTPWRSNEPHAYQVLREDPVGPARTALPATAQSLWRLLQPSLEHQYGKPLAQIFCQLVVPLEWDGATLLLRLTNPYQRNLCDNKLRPAVEAQLQKFVPGAEVRVVTRAGV